MGFEYSVFRVLKETDLKIDLFRPGYAPGQWGVPDLNSAVQITHLPTGLQATCSSERSQMQNKAIALRELEAKVKAEEDMESCECGYVMLDSQKTGDRSWDDMCSAHGVGTEHFQKLKKMPFGYAAERHTSRAEWLAFREKTEEKGEGL